MHTRLDTSAQPIIVGRRQMSRGAYAFHMVMIVMTFGMWLPIYWMHKAMTHRVRY